MWTAVRHALMCSLAGAALAALLGVAWQLVYSVAALGEAACDAGAIGMIAVLAAVTTGLASGMLSVVYQYRMRQLQAMLAVAPSASRRPARRKARLRARLSGQLHCEALSLGLCRLLHQSSKSLRGRPFSEILHPTDLAA